MASAVDLAAIYRKTEKGKQEVAGHALGLEGHARRLLIMIDGQRASGELAVYVRAGEFERTLERLLAEGFVEDAGEAGAGRPARAPAADDPAVLAQIQARAVADIRARITGRMADLLAGEIDACTSALELREKLRTLEESLTRLLGADDGVALARRVGAELTRLA
jgi:hypothetical protein